MAIKTLGIATEAEMNNLLEGKVNKLSNPITSGTYSKVTVNEEGLVSNGTALTESDIPDLSITKIINLQATLDNKMDKGSGGGALPAGFGAGTGTNSIVEGYQTTASGKYSHAEGNGAIASGTASHAEGVYTSASGNYSHAGGVSTKAIGYASHAEGYNTNASGYTSHAEGVYTSADVYCSHVMGRYNKVLTGTANAWSATADAFVIGNGSSTTSLSNAFRVTFAGATYGLSAFNSTGADYAEFFEWLDGNPDNEDRVGYFVTLDGDKIRKATSSDDYILGVVSATPSVIGDSYNDDWYGKYVTDQWGRIQYHYIDIAAEIEIIHHEAEYDEEQNIISEEWDEEIEIQPARQDYVPIINPDWDPSKEYIPRDKRPEWTTVGMMGKLLVRDDGTCNVNGYCKPNDDGIATLSESGYRVMRRVSDNVIQILLK